MKKVIKFVRGGKKDEKKEGGGVTPSQSGDLIDSAQTPEDGRFSGQEESSGCQLADFDGKDKSLTKLHKAAWQGNLEKLKSAFKKVEVDSVDRHNRTALHYAVVRGHPNIVWFLLGNNADPSACDDEGCTPLLRAVEHGHKECLKLLLDRGTDVDAADYTGNTALHVAIRQGSCDVVSALLKKGAGTEVNNNLGDYPLHIATWSENKDLVELLLAAGAEVNVLDRENRTPLMLAAKNGNLRLTKLFLERGAQSEIVDSNGWTAEDYALLSGHESAASTLKALSKGKAERSKGEEETKGSSAAKNGDEDVEPWDDTQSSESERKVKEKLKEILKKNSKEEAESGRKEEEVSDSPNAQVTPPYCQPPRSWEMIQAGMIDGNKSGSEPKRLGLTALGTLRSRRESFTEGSRSTTSPKFTLSLNRRKGAKGGNSFAKQRLSFNEEISLANWSNENPAKDATSSGANGKSAEIPNQSPTKEDDSRSQNEENVNICPKSKPAEESERESDSIDLPMAWDESDGTLGRTDAMLKVDEVWIANSQLSLCPAQEDLKGRPNSWDSEGSSTEKESNFPPPPSALELGADMAKSLKYMKGISEDRPDVAGGGKSAWKTAYDSHSLDRLDEKNIVETTRMQHQQQQQQQPFRGHSRQQSTTSQGWKNQDIPKWQKPTDLLSDANRRINEQLECYDQALRELAEDRSTERISKPFLEKISNSHKYHSLPSSKMKIFNEGRKVHSHETCFRDEVESPLKSLPASSSAGEPPPERLENNERLGLEVAAETSEEEKPEAGKVGTERKTKRDILMAMREVRHAIRVPAAFRTFSDDQILSPLAKPEDSFESEDGFGPSNSPKENKEKISSPENEFFFALGRQETVLEKSVRNSREDCWAASEESIAWQQEKDRPSEEATPEASEERIGRHHRRTSSFSPLGIIYREIQRENQNAETEISSPSLNAGPRRTWHGTDEEPEGVGIVGGSFPGEEEESKADQSADVSLSSGPIEPLGTEKDSGSEAESSHNDITPTHQYSLKNQQEWLKCHLKTATSEKNKLEEIAAQLLEKAERLQYELADAKEATKSRDEVIKLLQEQLARMETAYTKSLEESVRSRLQLTSHEQEILHLKEICYKYEEETSREVIEREAAEDVEKLEIRIKRLEEEKGKMKEEIVQLENEKMSLVKRLKELTESEIVDQCQRWKERCDKQERGTSEGSPNRRGGSGDPGDAKAVRSEREKQLEECNLRLEKKLLEMTEENVELRANLRTVIGEMESEKKIMDAKKESNDSICELRKKNMEMEAYAKRLEKEIDEKNERNLKEKEKEIQFLIRQFSREKESLIKVYEKKLSERKSSSAESLEENCKRENEKLRQMIENLRDQIGIMETKCSMENAKESLKAELFQLKNECDLMSKSVIEMQNKDHQDLGYLMKENAELRKTIEEIKSSTPKEEANYCLDFELASENVNMKNVILDLKNQVNSLTHLLGSNRQIQTDPSSRRDSSEGRDKSRQEEMAGQRGGTIRKKGVGTEDHLAWSNLYGIKSSERMRGPGNSFGSWKLDGDEEGEVEKVEAKRENEDDRTESLDKLELLRLKREIGFLQGKMSDERALRRALENQIDEINRDLREKQTLEQEVHSLKKKINRDYVQKFDLELVQYQKELQEKRERYLKEVGQKSGANDDFKAKCEILAKEREKSKEIKSKIWRKSSKPVVSSGSASGEPSCPVSKHGFSSTSLTKPEVFVQSQYLTLEPEVKQQLEKELDKSIRKHKGGE